MDFDLSKRYCYYFNEISKIPRGSGNEKAVSDYVVGFAEKHGLAYKQDHVWNVIIEKDASEGYEDAEPLIMQAHLDMVNEKNKTSTHNFDTDPLDLYVEDGWLKARGTTLGCDDGYGVSYMLAILEDDTLPHPPLVCIFTTMEEIGLLGAREIKAEDVHGKRLINLDSGGETITNVSSAGGATGLVTKTFEYEANDLPCYSLAVRGLLGGHSGGLIHTEKGNANIIGFRILKELRLAGIDLNLVSFTGGLKYNAIPREADAVFASGADPDCILSTISRISGEIKAELEFSDGGFYTECTPCEASDKRLPKDVSDNIIDFFFLVPDGFQHRSMAIEGLTVASLNMGVVRLENGQLSGQSLIRCALGSHTDLLLNRMITLGRLLNINVEAADRYPGWSYAEVSPLRDIYRDVLAGHGIELETRATHGGLEASVFKGLVPDMDIITFGPVAKGAHTPDETLNLESFDRAYGYLCEIIKACR